MTGTAGVVAAGAFTQVAGFFTNGTSATLSLGAAVTDGVPVTVVATAAPAEAPAPVATPVK